VGRRTNKKRHSSSCSGVTVGNTALPDDMAAHPGSVDTAIDTRNLNGTQAAAALRPAARRARGGAPGIGILLAGTPRAVL
jgi:hypothetical protein